ncbi:UDP-glucose/GDP-mannose dehydrogenase family protein [Candidatus Babeliales bacterium]|nr:UDP-glucose/GDP-mannose dehydrogenase family protein [Candidatus Babeliales bacterium]
MKIIVVGAGYLGLVTGACLAKKGHQITIVERDQKKIAALQEGRIPFYEPGLNQYVIDGIKKNFITFSQDLAQTLHKQNDEIIFSCVGTPSLPNGDADMTAVWSVMTTIGKHLMHDALVINKSTVPIGTARKTKKLLDDLIAKRTNPISINVASNPEFLREGSAIHDFMESDRVVCGIESEEAREILLKLYRPFVKKEEHILEMNFESAELTKYAANAMLATRISFINELSRLADAAHADIKHIQKGIGLDSRIGPDFLNPGVGYGGSCFPKDIDALVATGTAYKEEMSLVRQVKIINEQQKQSFIDSIFNYYGDDILHKTIGIWGLSFKPNTDDIRCAPSLDLINALIDEDIKIVAYDPAAMMHIKNLYKDKVKFVKHRQDLLPQVDALVIMTEWQEFIDTNPEDFTCIKDRLIFDGRNCFDPIELQMHNLTYFCVGRNVYSPKWHEKSIQKRVEYLEQL